MSYPRMVDETIAKQAGLPSRYNENPNLANRLQQQEPDRMPQIPALLQSASERLDSLLKEIEILSQQLSCVMRQEPNQKTEKPPQFGGVTPLSQGLASLANRIDAGIERVRIMGSLLEV